MIQLTPLDKIVADQELIQMGLEQGRIEGRTEDVEKDKADWQNSCHSEISETPDYAEKNSLTKAPKNSGNPEKA